MNAGIERRNLLAADRPDAGFQLRLYAALASKVVYDAQTGVATWLPRTFKSRFDLAWNKRYANLPAGSRNGGRTGGYVVISFTFEGKERNVRVQRLAWYMHHGKLPDGIIDHINGCRDDNRIANLRDVSHSDNNKNIRRTFDNFSGVMGVTWDRSTRLWVAAVATENRSYYLGSFKDIDEAEERVQVFRTLNGFLEDHGKRRVDAAIAKAGGAA